MIALGWVGGRRIMGFISEHYGPVSTGEVVHIVLAILCWAMWIPCRVYGCAIAFALLRGLRMGPIWATLGSIVVRVAGLPKIGIAVILVWVAFGSFGIVSPITGLKLRSNDGESGSDFTNTAIFCGFEYYLTAPFQCLL